MAIFRKLRPQDQNVEIGVGSTPGFFPYFRFNEPALNTFDPDEARRKDVPPYRIVEVVSIQVRRLSDIIDEHLRERSFDFLSVDAEGRDLDVLQSNDWSRYRPRFVLAETLRTDLLRLSTCPTSNYLASVGYSPIAKAYNTTFFERTDGAF
jgi:FkbM family methyltransferase